MQLVVYTLVFVSLFLAMPALAEQPDFTGHYEQNYLLANIKLDVLQKDRNLHGVAVVKIPLHDKWIYHFTGEVHPNGKITALHHQGSFFRGQVLEGGRQVQGLVVHHSGKKFNITFERP